LEAIPDSVEVILWFNTYSDDPRLEEFPKEKIDPKSKTHWLFLDQCVSNWFLRFDDPVKTIDERFQRDVNKVIIVTSNEGCYDSQLSQNIIFLPLGAQSATPFPSGLKRIVDDLLEEKPEEVQSIIKSLKSRTPHELLRVLLLHDKPANAGSAVSTVKSWFNFF